MVVGEAVLELGWQPLAARTMIPAAADETSRRPNLIALVTLSVNLARRSPVEDHAKGPSLISNASCPQRHDRLSDESHTGAQLDDVASVLESDGAARLVILGADMPERGRWRGAPAVRWQRGVSPDRGDSCCPEPLDSRPGTRRGLAA